MSKFLLIILAFLAPIIGQAQYHVMTFGPDSNGKYLKVAFANNRATMASTASLCGSQDKAYEYVADALKWDFNQTFFAIYDDKKSDSRNIVYVNPTWCTYTFDKSFSQVSIDPHRNTNREVLPLCEHFIVTVSGYQNNNQVNIPISNTSNHSSGKYNNASSGTGRSSSTQPVRKFKCAYCNGKGRIERNDNAPASFGQSKAKKKCNECGKVYDPTVFNHYHVQCGHCGGTGNTK